MKAFSALVLILVLPVSLYIEVKSGRSPVYNPDAVGMDTIQETESIILGDSEGFRAEIRQRPNSPEAYYKLGIGCLNGAFPDLSGAREAFKQAIALNPDYAEAYNGLGNAYHGFQFGLVIYGTQYKLAVNAHKKAIALKQDYPEAYLGLGIAHWGLEQYEDAIEAYLHAIKLQPDYPEAYRRLSQAYVGLSRYDDAAAAYQEMMALENNEREAHDVQGPIVYRVRPLECISLDYNQLGSLYAQAGKYESAIVAHRKAISSQRNNPMLYHDLGLTYVQSGDKQSALAQYNLLVDMLSRPGSEYEKQTIQGFCEDLYREIQKSS